MQIQNPTPVTPTEMTRMWVANMRLQMPDPVFTNPIFPQSFGSFNATLLPYDGTHLLATGRKGVNERKLTEKRASDSVFDGILTALTDEAKRQAGKSVEVQTLTVMAQDPARPVIARVEFVDKTTHTIDDCFALAGTDEVFAGVFTSAMAEIARQAGLTVS